MKGPRGEGRVAAKIEVEDMAVVATSGGYGTCLDPAGRFSHLVDPATGWSADRWLLIMVIAPEATTVDVLSTACSAVPAVRAEAVLRGMPGVTIRLTRPDETVVIASA
jgi:thiamine biosynthesis lipoprotein